MRAYDIIKKKRDGGTLSEAEIQFFIQGISQNNIPDYQSAAFLMAAFIQKLDANETTYLTKAMMESGDILDLSDITPNTVDKHSTGGVGDKLSLILAPAAAACGAVIPMMSGRGLGHTGGTLDKLESIPGFNISLSEKELRTALKKVGVAIIGQTGSLAPADKKLYALRDVTATVESIPLITGSIMSKKFAAGPASIVMDVKWGSGAFMESLEQAAELADSLVAVGKVMNRRVSAFITDMNQPLGKMVGNSLEIMETVHCLQGKGPQDVMEISRALTGEMLTLCSIADTYEEGCILFDKVIKDGSAFTKFKEMVIHQGGDGESLTDFTKLPTAKNKIEIRALETGYIEAMDSIAIGTAGIMLGGGRERSEDEIDHSVGIEVLKKIGDHVESGKPIAILHTTSSSKTKDAESLYQKAITITDKKVQAPQLICRRISALED